MAGGGFQAFQISIPKAIRTARHWQRNSPASRELPDRSAVAELNTGTALSAAELCTAHKLATADAFVYATARPGCELWRG